MLVKNIRFIDNKVEIVMEEKSLFISKENYIENPVTIDSYLSEEKQNYLLEYEKVITSKIEIIKKLNKKILTEYEIMKMLKDKEINDKYIKKIIEDLKRAGLINDEYAGMLLVESLLVKRKGKKEIKKVLNEKGINYRIIDKLINEIDEETYYNNFTKVLEKYSKMYEGRSFKISEQMIVSKLKEYGYEEYLIEGVKLDKNHDKELELAKIQLIKILKNKKMDLSDYENVNKIKVKLVMKGFNYDIINLALEEVKNNETY